MKFSPRRWSGTTPGRRPERCFSTPGPWPITLRRSSTSSAGAPRTSSATRWAAGWRSSWNGAAAPARSPILHRPGGWTRYSPAKFEVVLKFVLGAPLWAVACLLGPRVAEPAVQPSGDHAGDQRDARWAQLCRPGCGDRRRGAPTGLHPVGQSPTVGGLEELAETRAPAHLVICEKDRVVPAPRFTRRFTGHLPPDTLVTTLDGSGTSRCSRHRT